MKYYVDCEFDGHGGVLLSMALVRQDGASLYLVTKETATDPWVLANVVPLMGDAEIDEVVPTHSVGAAMAGFIKGDDAPTIIADSPVDIARFCAAISTSPRGGYAPCITPCLTFEVHDVDCYPTSIPGAVPHNAWWDAMALRRKMEEL